MSKIQYISAISVACLCWQLQSPYLLHFLEALRSGATYYYQNIKVVYFQAEPI